MMTIGTKIRTLRGKMSQETLAEKLGIAPRTLGSIESDETKKIDFQLMDKICKIFDVEMEYFIEEKQINNIKTLNGSVNNHGTINNCPENIIDQIKTVFDENVFLKNENSSLKTQLSSFKK